MAIVRWKDPFQNISVLQDRINKVFDDTFARTKESEEDIVSCSWKPVVDIYETGDAVVFKVELPGVSKEDVSVEVKDNLLTIKGERRDAECVAEDNYYRRERCCGNFYRAFTMPDIINPDDVKAKFKDGVLEIRIPRPQQEQPKQIKVNIE